MSFSYDFEELVLVDDETGIPYALVSGSADFDCTYERCSDYSGSWDDADWSIAAIYVDNPVTGKQQVLPKGRLYAEIEKSLLEQKKEWIDEAALKAA